MNTPGVKNTESNILFEYFPPIKSKKSRVSAIQLRETQLLLILASATTSCVEKKKKTIKGKTVGLPPLTPYFFF